MPTKLPLKVIIAIVILLVMLVALIVTVPVAGAVLSIFTVLWWCVSTLLEHYIK
jgi:hypothetical protein